MLKMFNIIKKRQAKSELTDINQRFMEIFVDTVRSCFKPADGRVIRNCLRFMRERRAVRLAFARYRTIRKIGKAKCVPKCKQSNFCAVTEFELK